MKKILIVTAITSLFIAYLFQHRYSLKCTQELAYLEKTRQLLKEDITRLQTEQARTFLFVNLEDTAEKLRLVLPKNNIHREQSDPAQNVTRNSPDTLSIAHKNNSKKPNQQ